MSKGMRRFSWLALLLWLGCGAESATEGPAALSDLDTDTSLAAPGSPAPTSTTAMTVSETKSSPASGEGSEGAPGAALPAASRSAAMGGSAPSGVSTTTGTPPTAAPAPAASGAAGAAASSGESADGDSSEEDSAEPSDPETTSGGNRNPPQSGTLTAGTWDDNRNFERFEKYRNKLKDQQLPGMLPSTDAEHKEANEAFAQPAPREKLDVSLVIDTTGSMGDEIRYLQSEFLALSAAIEDKYPDAEQRWSLVAYRDMGDDYVTRVFDFNDNAMAFRDELGKQSAGGGGDFPEAPDAALAAMAQLSWRSEDNVARLAFLVADAPHHNHKAEDMLDAIRGARELGVHVYPVASSGVDELTEVSFRSAAQLTGGRYLFLTDDSGVGGAHKEPTIPCYFVTRLDKAILRMVNIEISGVYAEPAEDDIIRTSGDLEDGSCELDSGEVVEAF